MATKTVVVPELGKIQLYKRRGTKSLRLSVNRTGTIRVSLPTWVPYRLGIEFAQNKRSWLMEMRKNPTVLLDGQRIGKAHHLIFITKHNIYRPTIRIIGQGEVRVSLPSTVTATHDLAQQTAAKACLRALKRESEILLPQRLSALAKQHGFSYKSVSIKRLSSRWGSCSDDQRIVLSCYLIQLPWELIDYVLLHELMHTQIMKHGPVFWAALDAHVPRLSEIRKTMKLHQPTFMGQ